MKFTVFGGALLLSFTLVNAQAADQSQSMNPALRTRAAQAIEKGLGFLRGHVNKDGSYSHSVGITGLALRGFLESPHHYRESDGAFISNSVSFLVSNAKPNGAISEGVVGQSKENVSYNTSLAMCALAATGSSQYAPLLKRGQAFLTQHQIDAGEGYDPSKPWYGGIGYGDDERPDMSNQLMALQALRASALNPKDPTWQKALVFISRAQNRSESNDQAFAGNDGGFMYMIGANTAPMKGTQSYGSMTSAGLISLLLAGANKNDPRVVAAYNWIKKNYTLETNPGTGSKAGLFYYYWAFAQAMSAMGEVQVIDSKGLKHNWRDELAAKLLALQAPDGSWLNKDSNSFMQDNADLVTGWAVNALNFALK
jgi:squalene-hopene/tetraprenyl-beta-curcumene cyclase